MTDPSAAPSSAAVTGVTRKDKAADADREPSRGLPRYEGHHRGR